MQILVHPLAAKDAFRHPVHELLPPNFLVFLYRHPIAFSIHILTMPEEQSILTTDTCYSPSALLHIFNSMLAPGQTRKIIQLKGVYHPGKSTLYGGYYYDILADETAEAQLTLLVPARLRPSLKDNTTIEFQGYITKRVALNRGQIEIQATITELLEQRANKYSELELRAVIIQQRKANQGFRDVEGFLKTSIVQETPVKLKVLIGKTAIIDSDIRHALEGSVGFYQVNFERINLSSETEILHALKLFNDDEDVDLLVLSRGGGDNMEVFNSPALAEYCLGLEPYFVTAIGHKEDSSLLQRIADKAFITPTALGQYLNTLYNETMSELQHSKAKLVATIEGQLKANYGQQINNLQAQIRQLQELGGKSAGVQQQEVKVLRDQVAMARTQIEDKTKEVHRVRAEMEDFRRQSGSVPALYWVAMVIVALVCLSLGKGCGR
jgi:exodeoxyribonuclease VII large subunit